MDTDACSWVHRASETWPHGAQVDLLFDRADNTMNLIEIKFFQGPFTIDKRYAAELRRKRETFRAVTGTKKDLFLSFLATHGLTENAYATELVQESIPTSVMFAELLVAKSIS